MLHLINYIEFCKCMFILNFSFQTSWQRGNKRIGKLLNAEKHLIGRFYGQNMCAVARDNIKIEYYINGYFQKAQSNTSQDEERLSTLKKKKSSQQFKNHFQCAIARNLGIPSCIIIVSLKDSEILEKISAGKKSKQKYQQLLLMTFDPSGSSALKSNIKDVTTYGFGIRWETIVNEQS